MITNLSIRRRSRRSLVLLSSIFLPLSLLSGSGGSSFAFQPVNAAPLINIGGVTINIPITVIIPITLNAQNAQVCLSAASSGPQTCQQVILNPSQNTFNPVNVDLTLPTPVFTSLSTTTTTASPSTTTAAGPPTGPSAATPLASNPTNNAPATPTQNVPNNGPSQNIPSNPSSKEPTNPGSSSNSGSGTAGGSSSSK